MSDKRFKHGMIHTRLYSIWHCMKVRCYIKSCLSYKNYGGRGIKICDEWKNDFISFYNWSLANGYKDNLTIDRIDVNGNYEPSNCRWVSKKEQDNNRRTNRFIEYNGIKKTIQQWAEEKGINTYTLRKRIRMYGEKSEKLFMPVNYNYSTRGANKYRMRPKDL